MLSKAPIHTPHTLLQDKEIHTPHTLLQDKETRTPLDRHDTRL